MQITLMLAQDFQGNRSLTGNNRGIIVGMDKGHALLLRQTRRMGIGIVVSVS